MQLCEYCRTESRTVDIVREFYINDYGKTCYTGRLTYICDLCFYGSGINLKFHETLDELISRGLIECSE